VREGPSAVVVVGGSHSFKAGEGTDPWMIRQGAANTTAAAEMTAYWAELIVGPAPR